MEVVWGFGGFGVLGFCRCVGGGRGLSEEGEGRRGKGEGGRGKGGRKGVFGREGVERERDIVRG